VRGRFRRFSGFLEIGEDESRAWGEVEVASLTTDEDERDAHLLSPDFLDANRFATIGFVSRAVRREEEGRFEIVGDVSLQDKAREINLHGRLRRIGEDRSGNARLALELGDQIEWGDSTVLIDADLSLVRESE
jgi:polyisoprenoid-binding protein YceI